VLSNWQEFLGKSPQISVYQCESVVKAFSDFEFREAQPWKNIRFETAVSFLRQKAAALQL
jgi:hypothetical protein